ncbi:MAG: M20/M25/M40 family metallo-hydrolase, partial [Deltaproteobacteria bacterium]
MPDTHSTFDPSRLKKLLHRLVDIYSPSGKEEEILHFLNGYLKRHGVPVLCQPVDEKRYNLVVMPAEQDVPLALVGHLDTVAAYDLNEYGYVEQGDQIKGLGTADMKGGCAAMVEAYMTLYESGRSGMPAALCIVVGEEEEGDGGERLVEDYHFPWAIVGEPTDLRPCLSNYGYVEVQICTFGKRLHASLANMTENPIQAMLRLMLRISQYMEEQRPQLVYNIRDL